MKEKDKNHYQKNLFGTIIKKSVAKNWYGAVKEWEPIDVYDNVIATETCTCTKKNIRYVHIIQNQNTLITLKIGSCCIKKFGRSDLTQYTSLVEQKFKLLEAKHKGEFITLSSKYFSRKLLKFFFEKQIVNETDYKFLIKMFNKRNKEEITERQDKKIKAIIMNQIFGYLNAKLAKKVKLKNEKDIY